MSSGHVAIVIAGLLAAPINPTEANLEEYKLTSTVNHFASETGLYSFRGLDGVSPDIVITVGQTLVVDQTRAGNWMHPIGFAFYPVSPQKLAPLG